MGIMTKIEGAPDRGDVKPGMAFFAGSGPPGETCGDCLHRGYYRLNGKGKSCRTTGCRVFKTLTGKHGPSVNKDNRSCKYFEPRNATRT
jgi:hypothetical protein